MSRPLILLVDDEPALQRAVGTLLRTRGHAVAVAGTGREALDVFEAERPALVMLDLGLPDMSGQEVCRRLRARSDVPILVLSARGDERSKVEALDAGADDYVSKPFGPEELLARVRAGLRRSPQATLHGRLRRGDLLVDFDTRQVRHGDVEVHLTPREFDLLVLLASQAGRVLTHQTIAKRIWGAGGQGQHEHLRVLVGQLRRKLEPDPSHPVFVLTEPWVGYRFAEPDAEPT